MRIYRDQDADLTLLLDKRIAVIGYGNQGRAQALNLRARRWASSASRETCAGSIVRRGKRSSHRTTETRSAQRRERESVLRGS